MTRKLNHPLTDQHLEFADNISVECTRDSIPNEIAPALLRECKRRQAADIRDAILEGYRDAIAGRTMEYRGSLRELLDKSPSETPPTAPPL